MKFKHVVLFGVVASIMSYLNSVAETEEGNRQEKILDELQELLDVDMNELKVDQKTDKRIEKLEEVKSAIEDATDNIINELNSIIDSLTDITEHAVDAFINDEEEIIEESSAVVILDDEEETPTSTIEVPVDVFEELVTNLENVIEEETQETPVVEEVVRVFAGEDLEAHTLDEEGSFEYIPEIIPVVLEEPKVVEVSADIFDELVNDIENAIQGLDEEVEVEENNINEEEYRDDLINDLESLLASIEAHEEEHQEEVTEDELASFTEEDFLQQIEETINQAILAAELCESITEEEVVETKEVVREEIDEIFSEILEQEGINLEEPEVIQEEILEEAVIEKTEEEIKEEYLEELTEELKVELEREEAKELDIYAQINELYPYLSRGFVRAVYDLKEIIANEYPVDHNVIILHRLVFTDLEDLRQFAEIVLNHDYRVNVDETKMIVDIFKEFRNTDGKILTNIFEIANQAKLLNGEYDGYRVEVE